MKYWVFQNNQVIGPYAPEDLGRLVSFSPESLVCSEGRKGTSMGDWQRAGMVPDLSVALVKAGQRQPVRAGMATLAGLPPEPTLKDLAVLGSLQEKVAMLEDVASQLQENLRSKDAELSAMHGALADKDREASDAKREAELRRQEAEELKARLASFEERLTGVHALSDSLDKAVEAEKQVQDDVLKQGETIAMLAHELEDLRRRLEERGAAPAAAPAPSYDTSAPSFEAPAPAFETPEPAFETAAPAAETAAPAFDAAAPSAETPAPSFEAATPAFEPPASAAEQALPSFGAMPPAQDLGSPEISLSAPAPVPVPEPSGFDLSAPAAEASPVAAPASSAYDPLMSAEPFPMIGPGAGAAHATAPAAAVAEDMMAPEASARPKRGRALLIGALLGLLALGGGAAAFFMGLIPGMGPADSAPAVEAPVAAPEPVAPPPPAVDPRQEAVAMAKMWSLPGGVTLGAKLDSVAPASGSLSPWMAETLPDGRVQVNYFASGAAAGSPTIAYEFVVDLAGRALSGRNAAAKSILSGKAPTPPKPLPARPVRVKPKKASSAPARAPRPAPPADDESLDTLLGGEDAAPAPAAKTPAPKPAAEDAETEALLMPGFNDKPAASAPAEAAPAPVAKPSRVKGRPSRGGQKPADDKASDEALLDDLLED